MRGTAVRVANSKGRATTIHRHIQCLYPLEIDSQEKESHSNSPNPNVNSGESDRAIVRRSQIELQQVKPVIEFSLTHLVRTEEIVNNVNHLVGTEFIVLDQLTTWSGGEDVRFF